MSELSAISCLLVSTKTRRVLVLTKRHMGSGNEIELTEEFTLNDGVYALDVRPAGIYVVFLGNMLSRITLSLWGLRYCDLVLRKLINSQEVIDLPSCPFKVIFPSPPIRVASTNMISPPMAVHAKPKEKERRSCNINNL